MEKPRHMEPDPTWAPLYRAGGVAALLAGLVFRRNIGAEISLVTGRITPVSVEGWYRLLQIDPLIGMSFLSIFDVVDYALVGLMFLALCAALWQTHKNGVLIATACGLAGAVTCFASNNAFAMISLSSQYAAATTDAQKSILLTAGQTVLALNYAPAVYQGTGFYMSLLLLAAAGMLFSVVMLRNGTFSRGTAIVGILAAACDLVFCMTFAFAPFLKVYLMSAAGLLLMIWHLMIARRLLQFGQASSGVKQ